jgi:hypothetical protein
MRIFRMWREHVNKMKDVSMQRELVGVDKYGNKYYQYFSFYGLPHRREVPTPNSPQGRIRVEAETELLRGPSVLLLAAQERPDSPH